MNPYKEQANKSCQSKVGAITGSPKNYESTSDKAKRLANGYAEGGSVSCQTSEPIKD